MTRPLRILLPGGYYHVTCRGNEGRAIYRDDRDRTVFLEKLRGSLVNYQVAPVLNRRVGRLALFEKPADYSAFDKFLPKPITILEYDSRHIV